MQHVWKEIQTARTFSFLEVGMSCAYKTYGKMNFRVSNTNQTIPYDEDYCVSFIFVGFYINTSVINWTHSKAHKWSLNEV